jgi:CRP-like cAMP-binding protein
MRENAGLVVLALVAALSLIVLALATTWRAADQRRIDELARSTNAALCTFKADLERRYQAGLAFLAKNPEGIPGISRADLEHSLANQRATISALRSLTCD